MTLGAPIPRLMATRAYGAHVEKLDNSIDECLVGARQFEARTGAVLIYPLDHPTSWRGRLPAGWRFCSSAPTSRPSSSAWEAAGCWPVLPLPSRPVARGCASSQVQAEKAAPYPPSLAAGHLVPLEDMATMADGIAVGCPGQVPYVIARELVESIEMVSEDMLSRSVLLLLERAKQLVEPAGAAAVARLLDAGKGVYQGPVVALLSGGNSDPLLLLRIIRHGLAIAGRYLQFRVRVPDRPGSLAGLLADLASAEANVVHIELVGLSATLAVDEVEIAVQLEGNGPAHCQELLTTLRDKGHTRTFG